MAHIKLNNENLPGIVGLLDYRPETARPLTALAEVLLADDQNSYKNDCHFCHSSHAASAAAHFHAGVDFIDEIKNGVSMSGISDKLRALLQIAHHVQQGGKKVTPEDIARARSEGATDKEIHDTVLIAAAFCMYNRYVDGLGTWAPKENIAFMEMGKNLAEHGYLEPAMAE